MFTNILIPIDQSDCARHALDVAIEFASSQSAQLTIVNVVEPAKAALASMDPYGGTAVPWLNAMTEDGEALLTEARAKATSRGVSATTELLNGNATEQIVSAASRHHCDLIVLGSHGRNGIPRMLIGSVAEGVMREAKQPTLVVHARSAVESQQPAPTHA